jgi:uracil-DNA glycosylase family 4
MLTKNCWARPITYGSPTHDYKIYPLNSPGMPLPGVSFIKQAELLGDKELETIGKTAKTKQLIKYGEWLEYLYARSLYEPTQLTVNFKSRQHTVKIIPGHIWSSDKYGPRRAKVMVIGKLPGKEEQSSGWNLIGPSGQTLIEALDEVNQQNWGSWYITNLVKWPHPEPFAGGSLPTEWIKDCLPLLHQELRLVRPDYILCLGTDAIKHLIGKAIGVTSAIGQVFEVKIPLHKSEKEEPRLHTAKVMACVHPAAVLHNPDSYPQFALGVQRFNRLVLGEEVNKEETDIEHYFIDNADDLETLITEIKKDKNNANIAWDSEWHGDHPFEPGAYLRTIQFSWQPKKACCVILRHAGGKLAFKPGLKTAAWLLNWLGKKTEQWPARAIGHFFRADLPWLINFGLDLREEYDAPENWEDTATEGGFDTGLAAHAVNETAQYKLEVLANQLLGVPRYDNKLQEWKSQYCKEHNLKNDELEGYGECPASILHSYSVYDADATRRLFELYNKSNGLLDCEPRFQQNCREAFWVSQRASLAVLEMEMTGLKFDQERAKELISIYREAKTQLIQELKEKIQWQDFNQASATHCRELLFGLEYSGVIDKETGKICRVSPKSARLLNLQPVKTTGKRSKAWDDIVAKGEENKHTPSTDKEVLGILAGQNPVARILRNIRFVDQLLKTNLRPPKIDKKTYEEILDEHGNPIYEKGLMSYVCSDGRLRTHIFQTKETSRWSCARPNLQSLSSRRESDYKKILGARYKSPLKSVFVASPGYAFVKSDLSGAELMLTAIMARCPKMIDHCQRGNLDKKDPNYFDLHSQLAVKTFKLNCEPTKEGLEAIGRPELRNAVKCVVAGTRLLTSNGWIRIEELCKDLRPEEYKKFDQQMFTAKDSNESNQIIGVYNGGKKKCLKITTEDGYSLSSSEEHKYKIMDVDGQIKWKKASDLKIGDYALIRMSDGYFGNDITFPKIEYEQPTYFKPIDFPEEFNEDWAAFLGLYISEGSSNPVSGLVSVALTYDENPEFRDETTKLFRRLFGERPLITNIDGRGYQNQTRFTISAVHLARWLHKYCPGISYQKFIPDFIFKWPKQLIAVFLRWLFEGDGTAKKNGKSFKIGYSTASARLAKELQILLSSFGIWTHKSAETRKGYEHIYWNLDLKSNTSRAVYLQEIGFVSNYKQSKCITAATYLRDSNIIPYYQTDYLKQLLAYVKSPIKEKCRECLRIKGKTKLNFNRLKLILSAITPEAFVKIPEIVQYFIELLNNPIVYQRITSITKLGKKQVYDIEVSADHTVCYDGFITHQTVNFGLLYGRGGLAISRAAKEEGIEISPEEAELAIKAFFDTYPEVKVFMDNCKKRIIDPGYMINSFGYARRFKMLSNDRAKLGDMERQAQNYLIQSGVAGLISRAVDLFYRYRVSQPELAYRLLMQIHDEIILEVPIPQLEVVYDKVIPACMSGVDVWACDFDGFAYPDMEPFNLGTETNIQLRWGETLFEDAAAERGIPLRFAKKRK